MTARSGGGEPKKAKFHDVPNVLRQKIGKGGIEPGRLARAETFIDKNEFDFTPYALKILDRLDAAIREAKAEKRADRRVINTITGPIMELKANGGMFNYMLVTEITDVVLEFLEEIAELNPDSFEIIDVHQKTLGIIIRGGLTGDGGMKGQALSKELREACERYRKKHIVAIGG